MSTPRILLFTGKGGVGKTTLAAASAYRAAQKGTKTLILSTDPAHSLSDAMDVELQPEPMQVKQNLYAQEIDLFYSMKKYWENIRSLMLSLLKWQGVDSVAAEEMASIPGMEEGSALLWLEKFYSEGEYDLIIVDSAPTGETLNLLTLPEVSRWWLKKAFPFQRFAIKTVGTAVRGVTGVPLDKGYDELNRMFDKLNRVQEILTDSSKSTIRLVVNPERMVIQEARRGYTYFQLYGYTVDAILVNRVLGEEAATGFFKHYYEAQQEYLTEIANSFAPLPILQVPHQGKEVFGFDLLNQIGKSAYEERNPADFLYEKKNYEVKHLKDDRYVFRINLPFVGEEEVKVRHHGEELILQIRNQRRNLFLPRFLLFYQLEETEFEGDWLNVYFKPSDKNKALE